jgi:hypothetical protein
MINTVTIRTQARMERAMTRQRWEAAEVAIGDKLDAIKRAAIVAMFADDELMDLLVLKGGNAMDVVHQVNSRASVDLDFSTGDDLNLEAIQGKVERALGNTFDQHGYAAFDIRVTQRPGKMPDELAAFWGGYFVEFKLLSKRRAEEVKGDLDTMRREAIRLGEGTKFTMDISRHEYIDDKQEADLDGYRIYVYSPEMIVCEKLRAICQQMPEYAEIIKRKGLGNQRARDFIDIEALVGKFSVDVCAERATHMLREMFAIKRVPLQLIGQIRTTRDFHKLGFDEVRAAMKPGVEVQPFDYYFDFVLELVERLKPLWDVQSPPAVV